MADLTRYPLRLRIWARAYCLWLKLPFRVRSPLENAWGFLSRGARPVLMGPTCGHVLGDGIDLQFGGMCPVQAEGAIDGREVYYRSRGAGWSFSVAPLGSDDVFDPKAWHYEERRYFWPDGGYVDATVSEACIRRAVALWRKEGSP